jgi:CDP-diacylglycerol--serine O-phosphatidyltransferase
MLGLKSLPNWFTVGNLFLGILAIIMVFNGSSDTASMLVIIAMLLDGLDGRVARALNAQSEFGKELDSLSDVISFGVAPAFVMYVAAFQGLNPALGWIVTALFPICGALRLARFNVTEGVPGYFLGLPIPAAGGVLCTLALFSEWIPIWVMVVSSLALSFLMVSTVKYPSFKQMALSRDWIWITPTIIVGVASIAVFYPGWISKLLFIPLLIYALFGLRKNAEVIAIAARRRMRALKVPKPKLAKIQRNRKSQGDTVATNGSSSASESVKKDGSSRGTGDPNDSGDGGGGGD